MNNTLKDIRFITKNFDDVKNLTTLHQKLSKQLRTVKRKLKTIETKYSFLSDIVSIGGNDTNIEKSSKSLFRSAGFKDVRHLANVKIKKEDLQIWCSDCLILIECKGTKNSNPPDHELSQIKKYIDHKKNIVKSELPVFGLTIINHDNSKPFYERNKNPIDNRKNEYAVASGYGIITTTELVQGFSLLKNNIITFDVFKSKIISHGNIKFGGKAD